MDSPGHCAQYCSYTFMEYETKTILCIITMDKRVTEKKSTNLEKACFLKGINMRIDSGLHIVEVVTDAHVQVASVMSKFSNICKKMQLGFWNIHSFWVLLSPQVVNNMYVLTEKDFPNIKHSYDIWHGSKNLGKKLIKVKEILAYSSLI